MSEQKTTADILRSLDSLAQAFNSAGESKEVASILQSAAQALRDEQKKNQELQQQLSGKVKDKNITFLIDGSGSMGAGYSGTASPLKVSLDGIKSFSQTTGTDVTVGLWGDSTGVHVITDLKIAEQGLNCGTDFSPTVDYMQSVASATKEAQHFVVLSDGDLFDVKESLQKAQTFLKTSSKTSIDFVVITNNKGTAMEKFVSELQQEFPYQVGILNAANGKSLDDALVAIAAQRTQALKAKTTSQLKP